MAANTTNIEEMICEWADADDIPYGEAEALVNEAVKGFARACKMTVAAAKAHINAAPYEKVEGVLAEIRARFSNAPKEKCPRCGAVYAAAFEGDTFPPRCPHCKFNPRRDGF